MKQVLATDTALVLDEFLSPSDWQHVWNYLQDESYKHVHHYSWAKAFRLSDGGPFNGPVYISHKVEKDKSSTPYPSGKALDILFEKINAIASLIEPYVGKEGKDWRYFFLRPYIYPAGAGLSWHRDNQYNATGALVYYAHPEWNAQWGGEFLIAPAKTKNLKFPESTLYDGTQKFLGSAFTNVPENEAIFEEGFGTYILPKPNRLVIITAGVLHQIKKVDPAAGDHLRVSIQGFFQDPAPLRDD